VAALHRHGAKAFGQFLHLGRDAATGAVGALAEVPALAPSPVRSPTTEHTPHQMDAADIDEIVRAFGFVATLMQRADFDGLEIHAAHNYLIGQFLSPRTNQRTDAYGIGSIDTRIRFLLDIVTEIRERVGPEITLGVRMSATEELPVGITVDDTVQFAERLQATGMVDYLSVTVGVRGAYVKDNTHGFGVAVPHAARLKKAVDLPILVGGRITTPELAERILAEGSADLVGMARALIADPELPNKAAAGRAASIRQCVGFAQDCRLSQGGVTCGVNASAGRETAWSAFTGTTTAQPRRIIVAGAGPGGMEAARLAASRGHDVTVYEAGDEPGGQLLRAARGPLRGDLIKFVEYLTHELAAMSVKINLGTPATADLILADAPDLLVVATGARPQDDYGIDTSAATIPVLTTWDLLDGTDRDLSGRALLCDDGSGFWEVCSAAEYLAGHGASVEFTTPNSMIGRSIPHESLPLLHQRLHRAGVTYSPFTRPVAVNGGTVTLASTTTGIEHDVEVDLLILQVPNRSVDDLATGLDGRVPARRVGDAIAPRRLGHATFDANQVIRELG
jgi:2,4-dienoyl-CoA reductase (NADPH2)